ncbi:ABC transporter permease [Alkalibaculum sp. M08DMB]|uniref:ABC transporter permease n=2 Tax=Alkalibaculum sporogenes TaxID=2655001 RepID=A0A6A7K9Q3_9FIRM|nr:ABC transporter permease [Alkalibaculum sporogenes]MPW25783.1 ABC transporter permease [Alkalibaculum sporogenes]
MLEKTQGILDYLLVSPLHIFEYLLAKMTSLTLIALFSSLIIAYSSGLSFNPFVLTLIIIIISSFFTLLGFIVALQCETINQYFVKIIPSIILLIVPCMLLFVVNDLLIIKLIPSVASIYLILGVFQGIYLWEFLIYSTSLIIFIILCFSYIKKYIFKILYGGK